MQYLTLIILTLYVILKSTDCSKDSKVLLSNKEIREILKCFGDLNLEEGCVVCRYITQKIYKVLDISAMCPDIVETKLKFERERNWNADPQMNNKWTVLFNLQKDYLNRVKPAMDGMKNYNEIFNEKIKKQKLEKQNLENLIQFQNKINSDLASRDLQKNTKFDADDKVSDDEQLKYKSNKIVAFVKPQVLLEADIKNNQININKNNMPPIKEFNKKLLGSLKVKSSSFIEIPESVYAQVTSKIALEAKPKFAFINKNENEKLIKAEFEKAEEKINNNTQKNLKQNIKPVSRNTQIALSSFLETSEYTHFDKNLFDTLIKKSENYNLETQRRGRRRSRFPDPQWDCAETQIAKLVRYLCEEEVSASYQKYCKPIFEQINTMIESYLYHDNNIEICQNLHMCPVSVDI